MDNKLVVQELDPSDALRYRIEAWLRQKYVQVQGTSALAAETHDLAKAMAKRLDLELLSATGTKPLPPGAFEQAFFDWLSSQYTQESDDRQRSMGLQYMQAPTSELVEAIASRVDSARAALAAPAKAVEAATDDPGASSDAVLWFMANGWDVTKMQSAPYLTDEANERLAWSCQRTKAPFCTNARDGSRQWSGPTPHAALQASVSDLGREFPAIAALQGRLGETPVAGPIALAAMEARKDAAYMERGHVVAALAKCFPSGVRRTEIQGSSADWHQCVYIDLPTGQLSWHIHDSQVHLFEDLPPYAGQWDGHTTQEKYERLAALQAVSFPATPSTNLKPTRPGRP